MKNQIISLMVSASVFSATPAFAMEAEDGSAPTNPTLHQRLELPYNHISDEEARASLENGTLSSFTSLNLSWYNIGAEGARALATGNLLNLTVLNLMWDEEAPKN